MTNREKLENANIVNPNVSWNQEQTDAIESLTEEEVDTLISVKDKLDEIFPLTGEPVAPVLRHS